MGSKDADTFRLIALAWLRFGDNTNAMVALQDMEKANFKADDVFADAAKDLLDHGYLAEAKTLMEKAWKVKPKNDSICKDFAFAMVNLDLQEDADLWMERARAADPKDWAKDWGNCLAFARAAHQHHMRDLAAKWFVRAITARPKKEHVWTDIATMFAEQQETAAPKSK